MVAEQYGPDGLRALAAFMHALWSDAMIDLPDGSVVPCDFVMQHAWALGGTPLADPRPKA